MRARLDCKAVVMRNTGLDLLRLVAVVLVLGRHLLPGYENNPFLSVWRTGGWIGVDLFFVLSGFLVSGLLFEEFKRCGSLDIKRFLVRRGFKIYPPLFLLIVVTVIFTLLHGQPIKIRQTLSELIMMQNYTGALWNHTWSLAVEWHFYLLLALILFVLLKASRRPESTFRLIPWFFGVCAVFCFSARVVSSSLIDSVGPQHFKWLYFGSHIRLDSLMFGVLLGYLWHFHSLRSRIAKVPTVLLFVGGAALFAPAFVFEVETHRSMSVIGYTIFYVASGFLVLAAVRLESGSSQLIMFLAALGGASYSIYLWHMAVNRWLWPWMRDGLLLTLDRHYAIYTVVFIVGSIGAGFWLNRLVEKPSLRIREVLFPRAKVSATASG